jgi:hypothetical protein
MRYAVYSCEAFRERNEVMKNTEINTKSRFGINRLLALAVMVLVAAFGLSAQNSLPAPGSGGSFNPAPIGGGGGGWGGGMGPGPGMIGNPGPPPPAAWGSPWGPGWSSSPTIVVNSPSWTNQGTVNVVACGYGARGVWRTIPLHVAYYYNGVDYDVTVLNAWNPWTGTWDRGVNQPAYNTSYFINGNTYDFYVPLSTGTYYFNL